MRLALVSDIHGNLVALDAVLDDVKRRDVDEIVCLGDLAADGPRPHEVIKRIRCVAPTVIMGNADAMLIEPIDPELTVSSTRPNAHWTIPINRWCQEQLRMDDREYLASLPKTHSRALADDLTLFAYHGSPRSWSDNILAATPQSQLDEWFVGSEATINVGGHTHEPLLRRDGDRMIVNPGSVGAAFDRRFLPGAFRIFPWAEYAVLNVSDTAISVEFHRVPIDLEALEEDARASGMPCLDSWLSIWHP